MAAMASGGDDKKAKKRARPATSPRPPHVPSEVEIRRTDTLTMVALSLLLVGALGGVLGELFFSLP